MTEEHARILLAGESWIMHTIHQKGVDSFTTTAYGEGHHWLSTALADNHFSVEHLPNHLASSNFPLSLENLNRYDAVILSDIGSNTLLLHPDTFERSVALPNRLELIREYVECGGGLVMIGGYFTFQGFEAKARYAGTPIETALPVNMMTIDDRSEVPNGIAPKVSDVQHPITEGLPESWPDILGYNRFTAKDGADVLAVAGEDPLAVSWSFGKGRSVAFGSDCGPHWAPLDFLEWDGYSRLWSQLVGWAAGR